MTFLDDEDRPDRPVPARKVAEQRWRTGEPWRVRERRRRRLKIGGILLVAGVIALTVAVTASSPAIPPRDVVGVASAGATGSSTPGSGFRLLFYGCHGQTLQDIAVYPGAPPPADVEFTGGSVWYVQAEGTGLSGDVQVPIGQTPTGFRTIVPFHGLPKSPPGGYYTLVVETNQQLVRFSFNASLVASGSVVTETGRYGLPAYQRDESAACG
jgi:hypothetical protein